MSQAHKMEEMVRVGECLRTLEEIKLECGTSRKGSKVRRIAKWQAIIEAASKQIATLTQSAEVPAPTPQGQVDMPAMANDLLGGIAKGHE